MTKSRHALRRFGGLGLAAGVLLIVVAPLAGTEFAALLRGYGVMLALSATYLLSGLWLVGVGRARRVGRERHASANGAMHRI